MFILRDIDILILKMSISWVCSRLSNRSQ